MLQYFIRAKLIAINWQIHFSIVFYKEYENVCFSDLYEILSKTMEIISKLGLWGYILIDIQTINSFKNKDNFLIPLYSAILKSKKQPKVNTTCKRYLYDWINLLCCF